MPIDIITEINFKLRKLIDDTPIPTRILWFVNKIAILLIIILRGRMFTIFTLTLIISTLYPINSTPIIRQSLEHFHIFIQLNTKTINFLQLHKINKSMLILQTFHMLMIKKLFCIR